MMPTVLRSLLLAIVGLGQIGQNGVPSTAGPDIVVKHRTDAAIARHVDAMTPAPNGKQIARWNSAICLHVLGASTTQAAFVENGISQVAKDLHIPVARKPCDGSIIIIFTDDSDRLTKTLIQQHPALFADPRDGIDREALADLQTPRPVRWLNASRTEGANGNQSINGLLNSYGGGSHIQSPVRENTEFSFVVVDSKRLQRIKWRQLVDYLALVTLSRPSMNATVDDSVLSIFSARDAGMHGPVGLTGADMAVLRGLYRSDASLAPSIQRSQIVTRVKKAQP